MTLYDKIINTYVEDCGTNEIETKAISLKDHYSDEEYLNLLKMLFVRFNMKDKLNENVIESNCKYLDKEDYLQEFSIIVYKAIYEYEQFEDGNGSFLGYVSRLTNNTYAQIRKNSHMRMTGWVPKEKQKEYRFISIDAFDNTIGYDPKLDKTVLFEHVNECIDALPLFYQKIIRTMYFSGDDNLTIEETAKALNIKERSVQHYRKKAFQMLYQMGIANANTLYDEIADDNQIDFYENAKAKKYGANDALCGSNNTWLSHYNYYSYK